MWYNYSNISIPEQPGEIPDYKVDILTTYFPGEPYQMTITTLDAINNISYPHTTYLCDEANDSYLKKFCEENGIIHVTRDNRINAKAGNINNALQKHATGDICVVLDPDHIPEPNFLDPILPHFKDPDIGFVQIVQSYYNIKETLVARGAAEQTFQFYGPMMMTLNSYGAVNAIGANCVFRRKALDSIGGHAPGLCEDMHTAMLLYSKNWKAIYLPEVLAKGLAPSNLTNFFKQQLKWSRGTFDLLVKVYPKIFKNLTARQKIHYGILPLHYLGGLISLINFLIPILSLFMATTPWKGNIIDFALVLFPVAASSLLIRTFIQKWVIEKKERGFHIIGGLLHINTWWIYIIGLFYTIIDKKVPYLPTPKENEWNTNYKIVIPNAIVAIVSIAAVIYGLNVDFTPYSIVMALFALFNAFIMLFGIYLTHRVTNQNRILRGNLKTSRLSKLWNIKHGFLRLSNASFTATRKIALPLLLLILIGSMNMKNLNDLSRWENVQASNFEKVSGNYLGIFQPGGENALPDLQEINLVESRNNINFNIISFYLAWNRQSIDSFPYDLLEATYEKNAYPMITWEPWASELPVSDTIQELKENRKVFKYIAEGHFDDYIIEFVQILNSYNQPLFLRFGHEFDNPQYPWSPAGNNTPEEFKAAWKHLHQLIKSQDAHEVILVWNPWKPEAIKDYYPGDEFVDWIGITLLNYELLNTEGETIPFNDLYKPFRDEIYHITRKPVMLAEFGSLDLAGDQDEWTRDAINTIESQYKEISSIVLFNSKYDKNIPENDWYTEKNIDWTMGSLDYFAEKFERNPLRLNKVPVTSPIKDAVTASISQHEIRGVHYKKGKNWKKNYYALTRTELNRDFQEMKRAGINTIQYTGSNIYDYNLLKQAQDDSMKVIYEFDIDKGLDFLQNSEKLNRIKENILQKVEDLKEEEQVIAYSFKYDLERYYLKPLLFSQRIAFLNWLNVLTTQIKAIDTEKPIIVELPLNDETIYAISKFTQHLPVDAFGLIVKDLKHLSNVQKYAEEQGIDLLLSELPNDLFSVETKGLENVDILLKNWQDERTSSHITFDGLVDTYGNKKSIYNNVKNAWTSNQEKIVPAAVKIIKPAKPLYPGLIMEYQAVMFIDGDWQLAAEFEMEVEVEWNLVKTDSFGNPLAIKKIGSGTEISLEIPNNYKNYQLLVTLQHVDWDHVETGRSSLHTPLPEEMDINSQ